MVHEGEFDRVKQQLAQHHQEQLLTFWAELTSAGRRDLLGQVRELDWPGVREWVETVLRDQPETPVQSRGFEPAASYSSEPRTAHERRKYAQAVRLGNELIAAGKVAGFVVAGGQGTRLGFEGPKGSFPISPLKHKTFFQLFAETIAAVSRRHGSICPWYIMTSPMNHAETIAIFEADRYYGLDPQDVFIFEQGTLPNFDRDGRILLADKARIARSPDGHGGCISALDRSGALEDMTKRGIEHISYWQVDNPLVKLFDPLFIGLHVLDRAEMSSKAVIKNAANEKVGNFCVVDDRFTVIEYCDLPEELAEKRNPDGSLVFELGSIAIHIINRAFAEKLNTKGTSLPLHRAVKKIPYIDRQGNFIEPVDPNGVKLERFVFDALPLAERSIILEIERDREFAPTKQATGTDSVERTREMMIERDARWLESAGIEVPRTSDGVPDCILEIAPGFALDAEEVQARRDEIPPIHPGDEIYLA